MVWHTTNTLKIFEMANHDLFWYLVTWGIIFTTNIITKKGRKVRNMPLKQFSRFSQVLILWGTCREIGKRLKQGYLQHLYIYLNFVICTKLEWKTLFEDIYFHFNIFFLFLEIYILVTLILVYVSNKLLLYCGFKWNGERGRFGLILTAGVDTTFRISWSNLESFTITNISFIFLLVSLLKWKRIKIM